MTKITRFVKVGFTEDEYAQLLLQAHDDDRDCASVLKVLWLRFTRQSVCPAPHSVQAFRSAFEARSGTREDVIASWWKDTER